MVCIIVLSQISQGEIMASKPASTRIQFYGTIEEMFAIRVTEWSGAKADELELFRVQDIDGKPAPVRIERLANQKGISFPKRT